MSSWSDLHQTDTGSTLAEAFVNEKHKLVGAEWLSDAWYGIAASRMCSSAPSSAY
jgi:hypothetical protein